MKVKYHQLAGEEEVKIIVGKNEKLRVICFNPIKTLAAYAVKNGNKDPESYFQLKQSSWSPSLWGKNGFEIILRNISHTSPITFSTVIEHS